MRFTFTLDCDNAAFHSDFNPADDHEARALEIARILRDLAEHVEQMTQGYPEGRLQDANGNTVGRWSLGTPLG